MPNEPSASTSTSTSSVAAVPTRYGCSFGQIVRETVTALLALAIAFVALWLLYDVHGVLKTGKPDNYDQHKEVLLLALGLLGTVIGYYFGRVPAERHADTARDAAKAAQEREQKVRREAHEGLDHIQQQHRGGAEADAVNTAINQLRSRLWTM
jgi:hypothetical protein